MHQVYLMLFFIFYYYYSRKFFSVRHKLTERDVMLRRISRTMSESICGIFFFFERDTQYYSREYRGARPSYGWACYMGHRQHSHSAARARAHVHACRLHWFMGLVIHDCETSRFCHSAFTVFAIKKKALR